MNKILVVDIDGTLCENTNGIGDYSNPPPRKDVIEKINMCYNKGYKIHLHTARGMNRFSGDIKFSKKVFENITIEWLRKNGVLYHTLRFGKPPATFYIDDKALKPEEFLTMESL